MLILGDIHADIRNINADIRDINADIRDINSLLLTKCFLLTEMYMIIIRHI